jgi:hypothetical protein
MDKWIRLLNDIDAIVSLPTAIGSIVAFIAAVFIAGYKFRGWRVSMNRRAELLRTRYTSLYAPLEALFVTTHITSCRGVHSPYLRQRACAAWRQARKGYLASAWRALRDRQETAVRAEVENTGCFPQSDILAIYTGHERFADQRLVDLIGAASRSLHEGMSDSDGELTAEEYALFCHIVSESRRLRKKVERLGLTVAEAQQQG